MTPYWFKPSHQPNEAGPVEFQITPLDLRMQQEALITRHDGGLLSVDAVHAIFARHVVGWRGIAEQCTAQARKQVLATTGPIFGFEMRDWSSWSIDLGQHAFYHSFLTEDERKNF